MQVGLADDAAQGITHQGWVLSGQAGAQLGDHGGDLGLGDIQLLAGAQLQLEIGYPGQGGIALALAAGQALQGAGAAAAFDDVQEAVDGAVQFGEVGAGLGQALGQASVVEGGALSLSSRWDAQIAVVGKCRYLPGEIVNRMEIGGWPMWVTRAP